MGTDGLGKKIVFAAVAVGAILLVLRIVGGRDADGIDESGIDRVDTGRSDEGDDEGGPVETGLERVSTNDEDDGAERDEVPVQPTAGRFEDIDLLDMIAIVGAGVEAARNEYRDRI